MRQVLAGVLGLTQPWTGHLNVAGAGFALASAGSWGAYILLTQRVGAQLDGLQGLALSLSTAALVTAPFGALAVMRGVTPVVAAQGLGLAVLVPLLPFTLEMLALRRIPVAAFGTLMALEPAIATTRNASHPPPRLGTAAAARMCHVARAVARMTSLRHPRA